MIGALVRAMRPAHWVKSGFVLVAPLFARRLLDPADAARTLAAAALFSLAASGVYLVNDVLDRNRDGLHPDKRRRPVAAGEISPSLALGMALLLFVGSIGAGALLAPAYSGILAGYVLIHVAYSVRLRDVVLLDVFCIASGFVLRVLSGAVVTGVEASRWLILTTIFLSLFLALCKRRAEVAALAGDGSSHRPALRDYSPGFLDQLIGVSSAAVVLCYSLYTLDERTLRVFGTANLVFTVPFVIYGVFRYLYLVHRRSGGASTLTEFATDVPLLVNGALWAGVTAFVLFA